MSFAGLVYTTNDIVNLLNKPEAKPFQILDEEGNVIVEMTGLNDLHYEKVLKVGYEPQENGEFNSNSKQGAPFFLEINAACVPMLKNPGDTIENQSTLIEDVNAALDDLLDSKQIVQIVNPDIIYDNMTLKGVLYDQSARQNVLLPNLIFQEVRVANVQFQPLPSDQVANPQNASSISSGQVQTTDPTPSAIQDIGGNFTPSGSL